VALDRETAQAAGLPVFALDALLYVMVTLAVVISLQTVGNILVLALLVTPAATARLLTDRLSVMMVLAAAIGGLSCLIGLYVSYSVNLASGGLIVIVVSSFFLAAWLFGPRHGLLAGRRVLPGSRRSGSSAGATPPESEMAPASLRTKQQAEEVS
jgi:manganese/iron transport system permease protein